MCLLVLPWAHLVPAFFFPPVVWGVTLPPPLFFVPNFPKKGPRLNCFFFFPRPAFAILQRGFLPPLSLVIRGV